VSVRRSDASTSLTGVPERAGRSLYVEERRRRRWRFAIQMAPILVFYVLFLVLPYFSLLETSFYRYDAVRLIVPEFTLVNYVKVLADGFYLRILGLTVFIGLLVTSITLLLGYPVAWKIVCSRPRTKSILFAVLLSPLLVNLVVRTFAWQATLGETGVINTWLLALGWIDHPLPLSRNLFGVVVGLAQITLPFMVLSLVSSMESVGIDILEAAESLGSSPARTFREILWPLTLPGVSAGCILVFCYCTSAFITPSVLGGGRVATIATQIFQQFTFALNWPLGSALVIVLLLTNLVAIAVLGRMSHKAR
jgi:putative spermidine/putrescine transport system permease protein